MIRGEVGYKLDRDAIQNTDLGEIVGAASDTVMTRNQRSTKGLEGLDEFLAPSYDLDFTEGTDGLTLKMTSERRNTSDNEAAWHDLLLMKRAFMRRLDPALRETLPEDGLLMNQIDLNGSYPFTLSRIFPTEANAIAMQAMSLQDLRAGRILFPDLWADPQSPPKITRQIENLSRAPHAYLGAFRDNSLDAFIKVNDWYIGDQFGYGSIRERYNLKRQYAEGERRFADNPLGIFALVADRRAGTHGKRQRMLDELIAYATFVADKDNRRIVVPVHGRDEAVDALLKADFEPTGKSGRWHGMRQELLERPAAA